MEQTPRAASWPASGCVIWVASWRVLRRPKGRGTSTAEDRTSEYGGSFNNYNAGRLGVTLNLRTPMGKELLRDLLAVSDVITENHAAGAFARMGFPCSELRRIRPGGGCPVPRRHANSRNEPTVGRTVGATA